MPRPDADHSSRSTSPQTTPPPRKAASRIIGQWCSDGRDGIARGLVAIGVTPNILTIAGGLASCCAAYFFFLGGGFTHARAAQLGLPPYPLLAAAFLLLAGLCDMLDGAVARVGKLSSQLGGVLDSFVDRCSEMVLYIGLIGHFTHMQNLTYTLLAAVAMANASLISYVKARSENTIPDCTVGYWMRGERAVALLATACAGTVTAALWQQALLPAFTVLRRLTWTHQVLAAKAAGRPLPTNTPPRGWLGLLRPWRYPRGTLPYDVVTGSNLLFLFIAPHVNPLFGPDADPLRGLLARLTY